MLTVVASSFVVAQLRLVLKLDLMLVIASSFVITSLDFVALITWPLDLVQLQLEQLIE
jgi:hypothetical protein